ncbi:tRNA-pseudouridine synthase [Capsaspora owczarzaki ATCC 30864]|uniref:tRNA-pseudouridine synthase n=1 Tax=Capsaspora owczarzaki (strain ATCC 30864) TaxID=595528 RepID=A0A0D2VGX8_CAPO3|nr:tRNA-pseudouridine synthase [Capsaspora owczarzaki ATCC 30864]KJE89147.1 tRNA-pseudouridine synthase [Capsaspora owczarzaki ATCC 30864]|eukprot:XP_004365548.1 tRNA-pseudouridine synthase [Capsaspora owczarzaki ATCC 30864]
MQTEHQDDDELDRLSRDELLRRLRAAESELRSLRRQSAPSSQAAASASASASTAGSNCSSSSRDAARTETEQDSQPAPHGVKRRATETDGSETCTTDDVESDSAQASMGSGGAAAESEKPAKGKSSKPERAFDFARFHKRHIALKIAYLGWKYNGLAIQPDVETVEGHLISALKTCMLIPDLSWANYSRCGRTDAGVSAFGQVVSLDVRTNLTEGVGVIQQESAIPFQKGRKTEATHAELEYVFKLNRQLPADIRVVAWTPVPLAFDARFSCLYRKYKYFFPKNNMNIEAMQRAAQYFVGTHDYRNFCKTNFDNGVKSFVRRILAFDVVKSTCLPINSATDATDLEGQAAEMYELNVLGFAFLYHQVRCMTSILFMVGQGLEPPEVVEHMLDIEKCPNRPNYNMASDVPLVLYDCVFEDLEWRVEPKTHDRTIETITQLMQEPLIRTTVYRSLVAQLNDVVLGSHHWNAQARAALGSPNNAWIPWKAIRDQAGQSFGAAKTHKPVLQRGARESVAEIFATHVRKKMRQGTSEDSSPSASVADLTQLDQ